ncbi:transcriptional regulator, Crp/Fnr family [Candidatus Kryptonium thompsonii]|uniref:Transcriptional regulator, Crp/Fnr family n=2 Tax=Candidatus Kryptonium thompsonii TaxID=1633631 RepID=A0A0P1NUL1_9BACT|nr:Crp/Fnr family transcriptional regulator [Candidatus Kryptonium thompsoni]CUS77561.1 transcriptional regulator, Crp/Fnr family [Candidatus Kryptonium thompsoni]CUS78618.1 transcriptional regulator, Crp/Fnr family [Candidatus Kryptonium thompsoni]CUS86218.1 transcriptional regulator, Crp/Fnr family [Candidatus Kryptonium thompsoni]CUS90939.1 transcriptional regulator, Crp/Fnr family [Candidatus Kryptonium thompsoni]CUS93384.1 transcriptional regulator, Crp/Fnr family [Candidatus Kryptonium t
MKPDHDTIKQIPLFSELSTEELRKFTQISQLKKFSKKEIIFSEGNPYLGFYILLKGAVRIFKLTPDGKDITLQIVEPFNLVAEIPLFDGKTYDSSCEAIEDSILLFIPREKFLQLFVKNPKISLKILQGFAKRLKELTQQIEKLTSKDVPQRLATYLVEEYEKQCQSRGGNELTLNISRSMLASYLGTVIETLSRALRKLQDDGLIEVKGKKIVILNFEKLKNLAQSR